MDYKNKEKLKRLRDTFDKNYKFRKLLAAYLEYAPDAITKQTVEMLCQDGEIELPDALSALVSSVLGLDFDNGEDRYLIKNHLNPSIRILDAEKYYNDKYYKNVKIPQTKDGSWELKSETYPAFRAVICDDLICLEDFTEIAPLGFFTEDFHFPAVLEGGNEWMTLTPVDMDTCTEAIEKAHGKVVTFGLGLGYYAYMVSEKECVNEICIVERSDEVIRLFEKYILPQFTHKEKVKIVKSDAFEYAKNIMPAESFDYAFVDIWRDGSDGVVMYKRMKPYESLSPSTEFSYWIEGFIKSRVRCERFEDAWTKLENGEEVSYDELKRSLI